MNIIGWLSRNVKSFDSVSRWGGLENKNDVSYIYPKLNDRKYYGQNFFVSIGVNILWLDICVKLQESFLYIYYKLWFIFEEKLSWLYCIVWKIL